MKTERRILFAEFESALKARDSKPVDLTDYVEMDPDSPRPRLRFRACPLFRGAFTRVWKRTREPGPDTFCP